MALKSIESVLNLDFDNYKVVTMDNTSIDGSFETIKKLIEESMQHAKA